MTIRPKIRLTPREDDVASLAADGLSNKEIASALGLAEHTVKFHVHNICTKHECRSRVPSWRTERIAA